jgi:hypothetical protein
MNASKSDWRNDGGKGDRAMAASTCKIVVAVLLISALAASAVPAPPAKPNKEISALEAMLHGEWKGKGCDGQITFRADGTYERKRYGPVGVSCSGTFEVRWDSLPPTLVLSSCQRNGKALTSTTQEAKIVMLNDSAFSYQFTDNERAAAYERVNE